MIAFLRLAAFSFVGLSVLYILLSIYSKSVEREELEKRWAADHPDGGDPDGRDAYIEEGLRLYQKGLRRKLLLLVYILPLIAIAVLMYLVNEY